MPRKNAIRRGSAAMLLTLPALGLVWDLVPFISQAKQDTISYFATLWAFSGVLILPFFFGALGGHWFCPTYWGDDGARLATTAAVVLVVVAMSVYLRMNFEYVPRFVPLVCLLAGVAFGAAMWPNEEVPSIPFLQAGGAR